MGRPVASKYNDYDYSNRRKRFKLTTRQADLHRASIETAKTIKALQDHRDSKVKLDPSQIRACEILLDRSMPRLSAIDQTTRTEDKGNHLSDTELEAIAQTPLKVVQGKGSS